MMMNIKKVNAGTACCIVLLVLALAFFVSADAAYAEDETDISYEKDGVTLLGTTDGETVTITGSSSENRYYDVVIPEEIDGHPVCAITANAFKNNAFITSVSLPAGITSLPESAFYCCSAIKTIDLNMVADLGSDSMGWYTLGNLMSLESVTVAADNPGLTVYDGVLFNKDMTKLLLYPTLRPGRSYEIPDGVTNIWQHAFYMTQELEEVTLSDDIKSYAYAFFKCPVLKTVNLNMLEEINGANFTRCYAISTVTVSDNNENLTTRRGVLFTKDMTKLLYYPPGRDEVSYTVPNGIVKVGYNAFWGSSLREIILPDTLKEMEGYSFAYCGNLEELILPEGLEIIGTNATTGCSALAAVYVPDSVKEIAPGSLDGPMSPPYAVIYGHKLDADGNETAAYQYAAASPDEYIFKDIDEERMPRKLNLSCTDEIDMDEDFSEYQIETDCLAELEYSSNEPDIVSVDGSGLMTAHYDGTAVITVKTPADAFHDEQIKTVTVNVTGLGSKPKPDNPQPDDPQKPDDSKELVSQAIKGKSSFNAVYGEKAFSLNQSAHTHLTYRSNNTKIAKVTKSGKVSILRPGKVKIYVTAADSDKYRKAKKTVTISARLKKPTLKARKSGTKVKLIWSKVPKAKGYELYIKYPGAKKYEKALSESASVKSVIHRGLTKGKTYRYKLRAYTKIGGKKYYSAFSKVRTAKIR